MPYTPYRLKIAISIEIPYSELSFEEQHIFDDESREGLSESPEEMLCRIEDLIESAQLDLQEAAILINDYHQRKDKKA